LYNAAGGVPVYSLRQPTVGGQVELYYGWPVTYRDAHSHVGKASATSQPTSPTQPVRGRLNEYSNPLMMGYEGNRRSGAAMAMHGHRLSGLSTYGLKGQCAGQREMSTLPTPQGMALYLFTQSPIPVLTKLNSRWSHTT